MKQIDSGESVDIILEAQLLSGETLASYSRISAIISLKDGCRDNYIAAFSTNEGAAVNPPGGLNFLNMVGADLADNKISLTIPISSAMTTGKLKKGQRMKVCAELILFTAVGSKRRVVQNIEIAVLSHSQSEGIG